MDLDKLERIWLRSLILRVLVVLFSSVMVIHILARALS